MDEQVGKMEAGYGVRGKRLGSAWVRHISESGNISQDV